MLQSVKSELERQTQVRIEAETKLKETDAQLKSIQAKSKQLINGMQSQLEEQSKARVRAKIIPLQPISKRKTIAQKHTYSLQKKIAF